MDETRRELLRQLALLAITPTIVVASPPAVPGSYVRRRTSDLPKIIRKPAELGKLVLPFSKTTSPTPLLIRPMRGATTRPLASRLTWEQLASARKSV
jgi:hypothetical protein